MRKAGGRDLRTIRHVIGKDDAERGGEEILGVRLAGACEGKSSDERHFLCVSEWVSFSRNGKLVNTQIGQVNNSRKVFVCPEYPSPLIKFTGLSSCALGKPSREKQVDDGGAHTPPGPSAGWAGTIQISALNHRP